MSLKAGKEAGNVEEPKEHQGFLKHNNRSFVCVLQTCMGWDLMHQLDLSMQAAPREDERYEDKHLVQGNEM